MCEQTHSLISAIQVKYDDSGHDNDADQNCIIFVPKSAPGKFNLPPRLTMDKLSITEAGDEKKITELCGQVKELDLTGNMISDWKEVFKILDHMPCLQFLNLTKNSLADDTCNHINRTYPNLLDLVLNGTNVSWATVDKLLQCFPSLTELHLSINSYTSCDLPAETSHPTVTKLFLNECDIHSSADITRIGNVFPNLESLNMIKTNIENLSNEPSYTEFPALKTLNISETRIQSWEEIGKLRRFPALTSLRISGLSFIEDWEPNLRRMHLVAQLPNIAILNGSRVSETEREDAERSFIRHYMDLDQRPQRYEELVGKHGKLNPLAQVDLSGKDIVSLLVKFEDKSKILEVNVYQLFINFKKALEEFTGLHCSLFQIFHVERLNGEETDTTPLNQLNIDGTTLFALGINDGDLISCERLDCGTESLEGQNLDELVAGIMEGPIEMVGIAGRDGKLLASSAGFEPSKYEVLHLVNCLQGKDGTHATWDGQTVCGTKYYPMRFTGYDGFLDLFSAKDVKKLACTVCETARGVIVAIALLGAFPQAKEYIDEYRSRMNGTGKPKVKHYRTLISAIEEKYANHPVVDDHGNITIPVPRNGPKFGPEGKLGIPLQLTMHKYKINEAGDGQKITELCGHVKELDLTTNMIFDWKEVFKILNYIPCLQVLNLSMNYLDDCTCKEVSGTFPNLRDLILGMTSVSWASVAKLLQCFPGLTELHLSWNNYEDVSLPPDIQHTSLTKLFMYQSNIKHWAHISRLGSAFPNLENLNMNKSDIMTLPDEPVYKEFPALKALDMGASKLGSWKEVEKFRRFPVLTSLKIIGVNFIEILERKLRRQLLIAYLPNISLLNGRSVSETEREDAERSLIRYYMDLGQTPQRYEEMVAKHGKLLPFP